jgi:hypothetical protein
VVAGVDVAEVATVAGVEVNVFEVVEAVEEAAAEVDEAEVAVPPLVVGSRRVRATEAVLLGLARTKMTSVSGNGVERSSKT